MFFLLGRRRGLVLGLFVSLLVLSFVPAAFTVSPDTMQEDFDSTDSRHYLSADPITILSNGDFATYASSGNGQAGTPWIIKDYVITNALGELIDIEGTTAYFVIENCILDSVSEQLDGIFLHNVQNGVIRDCTIKNNRHSIFINHNSQNILVHDNYVFTTDQSGIRVNNSQYITIANNTVYDHQYNGIWFRDSPHTYSWNNTVYDCETGIWAYSCGPNSDCEIINNTVYDCDNAIFVNATRHTTVKGNYVFDETLANPNLTGISLKEGACNNTVENNTIIRSVYQGLVIDDSSHNNTIMYNSFVRNNDGKGKQGLDNGTDNLVDYNFWDEWVEPDEAPADGIVDVPYVLDGIGTPYPPSDEHPLTYTPTEISYHFVSLPTLIYPNGGELVNDSITIEWSTSHDTLGHSVNYSVYYSANGGGAWSKLVANITVTSYLWDTSMLVKTSNYLLKVVAKCSDGTEVEDITDGPFTLQAHYLTNPVVLYPNGGEALSGTIVIDWLPAVDYWGHGVTYTIFYSPNSGTNWNQIVQDLAATTYDWDTTTVSDGDSYLIKVLARCSEGLLMEDDSDDVFSVGQHQVTVPTIAYPNGGELINESVTIQWSASSDSYSHDVTYTVSYSFNAGTNWIEIVSGTTETSCVWGTSDVPKGTQFLVKVVVMCSEGHTNEDVSDGTFTLQAHTLSDPIITSPAQNAVVSGSVDVTWTPAYDSWEHDVTYSLYYSDDGADWIEIETGVTGTHYLWDVSAIADGAAYRVKVNCSCQDLTADSISNAFTVQNTGTTTTTTTTTTGTATNGVPPDGMFMAVVIISIVGGVIVIVVVIFLNQKGMILSGKKGA